jgi:glycosyltransferase involved in cell wall biosynthesis
MDAARGRQPPPTVLKNKTIHSISRPDEPAAAHGPSKSAISHAANPSLHWQQPAGLTMEMEIEMSMVDAAHLISVLIITHDRHADLRRAIASVTGQTLLPRELLIVDDGSTPPVSLEGLEIPPALSLRLVRNAQPSGPARARNVGIAAAEGSWIAFLDDDDEFRPDKIEAVAGALDRLGDAADVLYHPAEIVMVNEGVRYTSRPRVPDGAKGMYRELLVKNIVGGTPMLIVRKQSLVEHGAFDESLGALEDYELWLRLARNGARFHLLQQALTRCHYATAKASITKSAAAGLETFARIEAKYQHDLDGLPPAVQREHREWMHEIVLFRAILKLEWFRVIQLSLALLLRYRRMKYAAAVAVSLLGPRAIIRLRARVRA